MLWFNIAHYAMRPWPWILTGLAVSCSIPGSAASRNRLHAGGEPASAACAARHRDRGISGGIHVHDRHAAELGRSYLVADFYRRFVKRDASEKHYVNISRVATVLLVIASAACRSHWLSIGRDGKWC